ncbi:DUF4381 domain-containing protein [Vibrio aquaticus]|uniref:DUF4381 domain-containing protein n=1 Tax=Vibrio aquaticus TaxID=2496559 RepID=A0A3S0PQI0_9VIBR|nr:DUF4381 domain-containing protein [Vibrio aquaticus]RTZ17633.1 DUF4381 domain-containing protein [Vibrio aquaticus]
MSNETQTSTLPLNPIHLPDAPSWLPLSWGWWATFAAIVFFVIATLLFLRWRKKRLAPKKTALRLLSIEQKPAEAIELVRQAALCYFPREEIAQLTGKEWYAFLDSHIATPHFSTNYDSWQQVLYSKQAVEGSEQLTQHCLDWVEQALPPKKRNLSRG